MKENPLTLAWARWRLAYERSALAPYVRWWLDELAALMPPRVRAWFVAPREELWLRLEPEALVIHRGRRIDPDDRRIALADPIEAKGEFERLAGGGEIRPQLVLCLPPAGVLHRQIKLPTAAEENLKRVLEFEMDRQTPFRADQLYVDQRVVKRDLAAKEIGVEWLAIPRPLLDAALARIAPLEIALDGADALTESQQRRGFNLIPPERRARHPQPWLAINLALAAVVVALAGFVMQRSLANREVALEALKAHTEEVHADAQKVSALREQLNDAVDGSSFLIGRKHERAPIIDIFRELTSRLPDDAFLQRVSTVGEEVQFAGQAADAVSLVPILQKSSCFEGPALQGAVTPDPRTNKQQFMISAKWRSCGNVEVAAAAPPAAGKDDKSADGKAPDGKAGDGFRADGKSGDAKAGAGKGGDGKGADGKAPAGTPAEAKAAEGKPAEGKGADGATGGDGFRSDGKNAKEGGHADAG